MFNQALFSSCDMKWETPPELVRDLAPLFPWDLDAAASRPNVCSTYYDEAADGLWQPWDGLVWLNPPYGTAIKRWIRKARIEGDKPGVTVVCLIPARTDAKWWQENVPHARLVVFVRGRLVFGLPEYWRWRWSTPTIDGKPNRLYGREGQRQGATFPSAFIVFGNGLDAEQEQKLISYGWPVWPAGR